MPRGASADDIRQAYRDLARRLHPDRHIDAAPNERELAAAQMRAINEAWHVLGNTRRRRAYDATFEPRPGSRLYADTTLGREPRYDEDDDELVDVAPPGLFNALRAVPWLLLFGVLAVIFVFTAYATGGSDGDDTPSTATTSSAGDEPGSDPGGSVALGDCVDVVGGSAIPVDCTGPNDGQVVVEPARGITCPPDTRRAELSDSRVLCLAR